MTSSSSPALLLTDEKGAELCAEPVLLVLQFVTTLLQFDDVEDEIADLALEATNHRFENTGFGRAFFRNIAI
jgi:hypothetical protein